MAGRIGLIVDPLIDDAVQRNAALRVCGTRQRTKRCQREMMPFH
jgi:hypothetical protein